MQSIGKYLALAGILIAALGFLLMLLGDKLNWFGNLPGDIKIQKENFSFFMPFTSMLLVSVAVSAFLWLLRKIF